MKVVESTLIFKGKKSIPLLKLEIFAQTETKIDDTSV